MAAIPKKGSYRGGMLFPDTECRNAGARCDKHCQHFKDSVCWVHSYPGAYYRTAEICSDYKPIKDTDETNY